MNSEEKLIWFALQFTQEPRPRVVNGRNRRVFKKTKPEHAIACARACSQEQQQHQKNDCMPVPAEQQTKFTHLENRKKFTGVLWCIVHPARHLTKPLYHYTQAADTTEETAHQQKRVRSWAVHRAAGEHQSVQNKRTHQESVHQALHGASRRSDCGADRQQSLAHGRSCRE